MVDVLIQTHNEELNVGHALASLAGWANRVFVVDDGSTDRTIEIATAAGATVVHHDWAGYAGQKNWALANLPWESEWVLIVDADEAVTPALRREVERVASRPAADVAEAGFYVNRMFIFMGRRIRHCGYYPSWNLRLFKRGRASYEDRRVHEHMRVSGPTAYLPKDALLLHEDRRGLEHFIAKHNRYSTLEAQELYDVYVGQPKWPGVLPLWRDPMVRRRFLKTRVLPNLPVPWLWKFLLMYVYLEGFLDRLPGFNLCLLIGTYEYFIYLKFKELRRLGGGGPPASGLSKPEGTL
jgi:glycosyltransferase involved in cell wall biosynthesis